MKQQVLAYLLEVAQQLQLAQIKNLIRLVNTVRKNLSGLILQVKIRLLKTFWSWQTTRNRCKVNGTAASCFKIYSQKERSSSKKSYIDQTVKTNARQSPLKIFDGQR